MSHLVSKVPFRAPGAGTEGSLLARTETVAIVGTEAHLVQVETQTGSGIPKLWIVGLPTRPVREAEQRVRAAIESSKLNWPGGRLTVNLAPGGLPKEGSHFDLAIALGLLMSDRQVAVPPLEGLVVLGELALDGSVRPIRGVLAAAMAARKQGRRGIVCPTLNAPEAALVDGIDVVPVRTLQECRLYASGDWLPPPVPAAERPSPHAPEDMAEVRGQEDAKQAAEIAAAGSHNLLLHGSPGSGKTMLARRVPGLLPEMSTEESLEVTRIHSVAGLLGENAGLITQRPFRIPHHHVSLAGLIGGGPGLARPGEISLAHNGSLFLDELTLYRREVLESLRAPLEDGVVRIARSGGTVSFPCRFSLIAAMNPCPCGYNGDAKRRCRCNDRQIELYRARFSGPLIDRFDLQVPMPRLTKNELLGAPSGESTARIRERVSAARRIQAERYGSELITNATAPRPLLVKSARLSPRARSDIGDAIDAGQLTGRGVDRVLRVARTLADLAQRDEIPDECVAQALLLRFSELTEGVAA